MPTLKDNPRVRNTCWYIIGLSDAMSANFLVYAFPALLLHNGFTPEDIGLALFVIMIPLSIRFLVGPFLDRFQGFAMGRRRAWIIISQMFSMSMMLVLSFMPITTANFKSLLFVLLINRIGKATSYASLMPQIIEYCPKEEYKRVYSIYNGFVAVGIAFGILGIGMISAEYGLNTGFFAIFITALILRIPALSIREEKTNRYFSFKYCKSNVSKKVLKATHTWKELLKTFLKIMRVPKQKYLCLVLLFISIDNGVIAGLAPLFLTKTLGWSATLYSMVMGAMIPVTGVLGSIAAGILLVRYKVSNLRLMIFIGISYVIVMLFAFLSQDYWLTQFAFYIGFLLVVFVSLFDQAFNVALDSYCMLETNHLITATQMNIYQSTVAISFSLGTLVFTVIQNYLAVAQMFLFLVAFQLLFTLAIGIFKLKFEPSAQQA